ncbi:hypothetical protein DFH09DRAFT_1323356 [Mycena vulgaris]|nr:hypothetical protein DFH09DRAFT_1323356 [Mycena vulgaris]
MSQSGNAALAPEDPSNALPIPPSHPKDLPSNTETPIDPPPTTPGTLIAKIRSILAEARAKKSKPSMGVFNQLSTSLASLELLVGCGDHLEASLKAFKADLLADVAVIALHAQPASSYTSVSSSAPGIPAPPRAIPPTPPKPTASKTCELTLLLDHDSEVLSFPAPAIKAKISATISATGIERLKDIALRAATLLKQSAAHWVPRLAKQATLITPRCLIVVDAVPTSFKPTSPTAAHELYAHNRGAIADPSAIKASSLLFTLSDIPSADRSISNTTVRRRPRPVPAAPARIAPRTACARRAPRSAWLESAATTSLRAATTSLRAATTLLRAATTSLRAAPTARASTRHSTRTAPFGSGNATSNASASADASTSTRITTLLPLSTTAPRPSSLTLLLLLPKHPNPPGPPTATPPVMNSTPIPYTINEIRVLSLNSHKEYDVLIALLNSTDPKDFDVYASRNHPPDLNKFPSLSSPHWDLVLPTFRTSSPATLLYINKSIPIAVVHRDAPLRRNFWAADLKEFPACLEKYIAANPLPAPPPLLAGQNR